MLLDKAVHHLRAAQKQPSFTDEEHSGMLVAKTLTRLNPRQKILAKKRIIYVLFDVEFHAQGAEVSSTHKGCTYCIMIVCMCDSSLKSKTMHHFWLKGNT